MTKKKSKRDDGRRLRKELAAAAKAAGAASNGDYFVHDGMLFMVTDGGDFMRRDEGGLDIKKMEAVLGSGLTKAKKLARLAEIAADAAREKWGVGDPEKFKPFTQVVVDRRVYDLGWGEHPFSRGDEKGYARMGRDFEGFNGHRIPWHIEITESNYLKESHLSGNQVRKSCVVNIYADIVHKDMPARKLIFTFGCREVAYALKKLPLLLIEIGEHPVQLWKGGPGEFTELVGRKVWWRDTPGVVERYLPDQGALIIKSEGGEPFPQPAWRKADRDDNDFDDDREDSIKVDFLDAGVWWFRK